APPSPRRSGEAIAKSWQRRLRRGTFEGVSVILVDTKTTSSGSFLQAPRGELSLTSIIAIRKKDRKPLGFRVQAQKQHCGGSIMARYVHTYNHNNRIGVLVE